MTTPTSSVPFTILPSENNIITVAEPSPKAGVITFYNRAGLIVGELDLNWTSTFTGDVDASARIFFDAVISCYNKELLAQKERADRLQEENVALCADAERYRWLRKNRPELFVSPLRAPNADEIIDAVIDAARRET